MTKVIALVICVAIVAAHSTPEAPETSELGDKIHGLFSSSREARKYHSLVGPSEEYGQNFWTKKAKHIVSSQTDKRPNKNKAKNIIMFLGDGMGIQTVTAARMLLGGESKSLSFEEFPHSGSVKTYCVDQMIADSACSATAYLGGVKTNLGIIGMNAQAGFQDCASANDKTAEVESIVKWAQDAGKSTGIVTTTRVTHASPSAAYAHSPSRDWEVDSWIPEECANMQIDDIAKQLVRGDVGKNLNVILGGGRSHFFSAGEVDEFGVKGNRNDGLDLISEWANDGKRNKKFVKNREQLMDVSSSRTDYLFGLFNPSHLKYFAEGDKSEPTLWDMTKKALEVLKKNKEGFFLFVEGGKIDHGHHENMATIALMETVQFHEAIEKTRKMFSDKDTLIVTTADHSHVMSISGYSTRGNDISGLANVDKGLDGKPYFTLSYADGPASQKFLDPVEGRKDLTGIKQNPFSQFPAIAPTYSESHGGEDVPVYASGPWSHLFTGTLEQNAIPHFMAYASCIGKGLKMCT